MANEHQSEHALHRRVASLRDAIADTEHLDYDTQLLPYAEGRLRSADVDAHLYECAVCRREVDDLRQFIDAVPPRRSRAVVFALAAAAVIAIVATFVMFAIRNRPEPVVPNVPQQATVTVPQPLVVSLNDANGIVRADAGGRIAEALTHPDLAPPAVLATLAASVGELRGELGTSTLSVTSPIAVAVVSATPRFTWRGPQGAKFHVAIFDESMEKIAEGDTDAMEWSPANALPRGRTYAWQVSTTINGKRVVAPAPPLPTARFRVIDRETADAIDAANGHLAAGLLSYDAGALDDARRAFEQLAALNPQSDIPRRLIAS